MAVCLERVEISRPIRLSYEQGHLLPLMRGAGEGAARAREDADLAVDSLAPFERFTDTTITDPTICAASSPRSERGYALSNGERDVGVRGVAAPVFGPMAG
jgi:DNA-binding IclR family transcriptional regulator